MASPIQFTYIAPSQTRIPGVEVEIDASQANSAVGLLIVCIIGQITSSGTATPGVPVQMPSNVNAINALCGAGSQLALQAARYLARDPIGPVILLPLSDLDTVAATWTIAPTAAPTSPGTLIHYIAGQRVLQGVTAGMTTTAIATALAATVNSNTNLPVTATAASGVVTLTSKNKGLAGNDIQVIANYYGAVGGEAFPAGYAETITSVLTGTINPSLTAPLLALGEQPIEIFALPYTDATSIASMVSFLADDVGRWSPTKMIYGHAVAAARGTVGALTTLGAGENFQHVSIMGFNGSADPAFLFATDLVGSIAGSVRANPALPFNTLPLGVSSPPLASRFVFVDRNTLLFDGISTFLVDTGGVTRIERLITTYQFNAAGAPDSSYLNAERMFQLPQVIRLITNFQKTTFQRAIVVADNSFVPPNSNYVNANTVRAATVAFYQQLELQGVVTNSTAFAAGYTVVNQGNGVFGQLLPITLPNQLELLALKVQFKAA